jgi:Ca2+/Na+ antiporter
MKMSYSWWILFALGLFLFFYSFFGYDTLNYFWASLSMILMLVPVFVYFTKKEETEVIQFDENNKED